MKLGLNKYKIKRLSFAEKYIHHILYYYHIKYRIVLSPRDLALISEHTPSRVFQILKSLEKKYLVTKVTPTNLCDKRLSYYGVDEPLYFMTDLKIFDNKKHITLLYDQIIEPAERVVCC